MMNRMANPTLVFSSERAANLLVAGIPAAVRAIATANVIDARFDPATQIDIAVPGGWRPSAHCLGEFERLLPTVSWHAVDALNTSPSVAIRGANLQSSVEEAVPFPVEVGPLPRAAEIALLRRSGRRIVAATAKAEDGVVSRLINRPISQAITRSLLPWPNIRPWHATLAAAAIGIAMFFALVTGGAFGLLLGAALYQCASIVDGVDGEIARATSRSSELGAKLDVANDIATNLAFLTGTSFNLYMSGDQSAGLAGGLATIVIALSWAILARQSRLPGGTFKFDAVKRHFEGSRFRGRKWLVWLAMRDFYAFAAFWAILAGAAAWLLYAFAAGSIVWLAILARILARRTPGA